MSGIKSFIENNGGLINLGEKINWYPGHMYKGM